MLKTLGVALASLLAFVIPRLTTFLVYSRKNSTINPHPQEAMVPSKIVKTHGTNGFATHSKGNIGPCTLETAHAGE